MVVVVCKLNGEKERKEKMRAVIISCHVMRMDGWMDILWVLIGRSFLSSSPLCCAFHLIWTCEGQTLAAAGFGLKTRLGEPIQVLQGVGHPRSIRRPSYW